MQDYFPELLALDQSIFPEIDDIKNVLGHLSIQPLPIPADCMDGFLGAYWRRPHSYLDATIRSCISSFSRIKEVEPRPEEPRKDLESGVRERKNQQLLTADTFDVRKLIGKINNGFDYWFTFVIHSDVEPTNNRAERSLREHVVLRKILGTLRNSKRTSIHERIMTVLATWEQNRLNSLQMLRSNLHS